MENCCCYSYNAQYISDTTGKMAATMVKPSKISIEKKPTITKDLVEEQPEMNVHNSTLQADFFLGLPAELRNIFYELVLKTDSVLSFWPGQSDKIEVRVGRHKLPAVRSIHRPWTQPALTCVCRQMRKECLSIAYTGNTFEIEIMVFKAACLYRWLQIPTGHEWTPTVHAHMLDTAFAKKEDLVLWVEKLFSRELDAWVTTLPYQESAQNRTFR